MAPPVFYTLVKILFQNVTRLVENPFKKPSKKHVEKTSMEIKELAAVFVQKYIYS